MWSKPLILRYSDPLPVAGWAVRFGPDDIEEVGEGLPPDQTVATPGAILYYNVQNVAELRNACTHEQPTGMDTGYFEQTQFQLGE